MLIIIWDLVGFHEIAPTTVANTKMYKIHFPTQRTMHGLASHVLLL